MHAGAFLPRLGHSGLSADATKCCGDVLDLMLVAEEFLCPSLRQECEIRLLAPRTEYNRCFCCLCASTSLPRNIGTASHPAVQCVYRISFGVSHLVSEETSLDVLATVQSLVDECFASNYTIDAIETGGSTRVSFAPLEQLRDVALNTILCRFGSVMVSSAFRSLLSDNSGDSDAASLEATILHSCLCEMALPRDNLTS